MEGPEIALLAAKATSVALILNELVQNAVEHGFRDIDSGKIAVLLADDDRKIRLEVTNDGNPLPPDFDVHKDRNLGLQIVENLVRDDLHGQFELKSGEHIQATVTFPK